MRIRSWQPLALSLFLLTSPGFAAADDATLARDILAELIESNTAPSGGNDTREAVGKLVARLRDAGFDDRDIHVLAQAEKLPSLVIRYRAMQPDARPILMMAHLDVVEALPSDWSVDPFTFTEKDGYYYGRGATDNKTGAAILVATLIRLKLENFQPSRDLVVMLTADEETTGAAAEWLMTEHRELVDAEFALNTDAGLVMMRDGRPLVFNLQTSEKVYVSVTLEALDPGGHSSLPRTDSAISRLARVLVTLDEHRFPVDLNETTQAFFAKSADLAPAEDRELVAALAENDLDPALQSQLDAAPYYNALARTTCVATQVTAGHAENALPQSAKAVVNCRVLPHERVEDVIATLDSMASPHAVSVTQIAEARPSPPSPLTDEVLAPITAVAEELWPGVMVVPEMSTGATDGLFVRTAGIPVYGVSAIAMNPDDIRAHGQDERISVQSFNEATQYWYRLTRLLAGPAAASR